MNLGDRPYDPLASPYTKPSPPRPRSNYYMSTWEAARGAAKAQRLGSRGSRRRRRVQALPAGKAVEEEGKGRGVARRAVAYRGLPPLFVTFIDLLYS